MNLTKHDALLESLAELNGSPVTSAALQALALMNYGHFTSMRVDDRCIRGLSHHLDRLVRDCQLILGAHLDRDRVREFVRHAVAGRRGPFAMRVTIFDPALELGHPGGSADPGVLVTTRPTGAWPAAPARVQTFHYCRDLPQVKHVGLLGPLWIRRQAQLNGYDDALFVDADSVVSEGATWNIGFYDGDNVIWPDAEGVLPGVTMTLLGQVHEESVTAPVAVSDIPDMKAAFATNVSVGVRAISAIDDTQLDRDHPILATLRSEYGEIPAERP